jgi:hypothetical protein
MNCTQVLWLLFAVGTAAGTELHAQPSPLPPHRRIEDNWISVIPASTGVRAGIMTGDLQGSIDPDVIAVLVPDTQEEFLCLNLNSRDSRYNAEWEHRITGLSPGLVWLHIPSRYRERLARYRAGQVAALARLGPCASGSTPTATSYLATSWTGDFSGVITVFINSRSPTVTISAPELEPIRCSRLPGGVAYRYQCAVPLVRIGNQANLVVRRRNMDGTYEINININIKIR